MQRFFLHLLCFVLVLSSSIIGATVPSQYIVYAVDTCKIGDRAGTTGSGLIGSAKLVSIGSDAVINGDIYSAGTINLFDRAIVNGSVTAKNSINKSFGVVVNGTTNPNTTVVSYTIPTKSFTTGTTNVFVPLDSTKVIAPGNYGDITISARSTVTFSNGIYNVKSLIIDNDVKVKLDFPSDGKIEFNSSGTLTIGDRVVTTFLHNNNSYAVNYYSAGTATVRVGFDGTAYGNIVAPNALVIIHRGTQFTGTVYAKKIELQPSVFYEADVVAPNLRITYPVNGTYSSSRTPRVVVMYTDDKAGLDISTLRVYINGADRTSLFTLNGDSAVWQIPSNYKLPEGQNTIAADVKDRSANLTHAEVVFKVDESKPVIAFVSPVNGTSSPIDTPLVSVSFSDQLSGINKSGFIALLDGCNVTSQFTLTNTTAIYQMRLANKLSSGTHTFSVSISDSCGNVQSASSSYTVNKPPVTVAITTPANGSYTNQNPVPVQWSVNGIEQTTLTTQTLVQGNNVITRSFTDQYGTTGTASVNITLDTQAPIVAISSPTDNSITNQSNATVTWTVDEVAQTTQTTVTLTEGANTITRSVTDAAGNTGTASVNVTLDTQAPVVAISSPADNSITNQSTAIVAWTVDGVTQTAQTTATLTEGANTITRSVTDAAGNTGTASVNVTLDARAPVVAISSPLDNSLTNQSTATVAWTVDGIVQTTETTTSLTEGSNTITRSVTDAAGNTGTASVNVTLDTQAPVVAISSPLDNEITNQNPVTVIWSVDGENQVHQTSENLVDGSNRVIRSFTDNAGNTGTASINVILDVKPVIVKINSPQDNDTVAEPCISVNYSVDDTLKNETDCLSFGVNTIKKSFCKTAINCGADSISVFRGVKVPVIYKLTYSEAEALLTANNLVVGNKLIKYSDDIPKDAVIEQYPSANKIIPQNSKVDLTISLGSGQIDLKPVYVKINAGLKDNYTLNGQMIIKIMNFGSSTAVDPYTVSVFKDSDRNGVIEADLDEKIGAGIIYGPHKSGDTLSLTISIDSDTEIHVKNEIIGILADSKKVITETNENNNTISIQCSINTVPKIITSPDTIFEAQAYGEEKTYLYNCLANDRDNDLLKYKIVNAPSGVILDSLTGNLSWTLNIKDTGVYSITISVSDLESTVLQQYILKIIQGNKNPTIISTPPAIVNIGNEYIYDVSAVDPDGKKDISLLLLGTGKDSFTNNGYNKNYRTALYLLNVTDPENLILEDSADFTSVASQSAPYQIATQGNYVYSCFASANADMNIGFTIHRLISYKDSADTNLTHTKLQLMGSGGNKTNYFSIAVKGNYAYLGLRNGNLHVYNISDPVNPHLTTIVQASLPGNGFPYEHWDLKILDNYLYSALDEFGLTIFDISSPAIPVLVGNKKDGPYAKNVYVDASTFPYCFTTYTYAGSCLAINDVSNPGSILTVKMFNQSYQGWSVACQDKKAYLFYSINDIYDSSRLSIIDYSTISNLKVLGTVRIPRMRAGNVFVDGKYAYLSMGDYIRGVDTLPGGLNIIDISDSLKPIIKNSFLRWGNSYYSGQRIALKQNNVSYTLANAPEDMTIDTKTGKISWVPSETDAGVYIISIVATDVRGGTTNQTFTLRVNNLPAIISNPPETVLQGWNYNYQINATDQDGDVLKYTLINGPAEMQIDSISGNLNWIPADTGIYSVKIAASDCYNAKIYQQFNIHVITDTTHVPVITSTPPATAFRSKDYVYQVYFSDEDNEELSLTLVTYPNGMSVSENGIISWKPSADQIGNNDVQIQVTDGHHVTSQNFTVEVENYNTPPKINPISDTSIISGDHYSYTVRAIDSENDQFSFKLSDAPYGMKLIPVNSESALITWVPDTSGSFTIRLSASDSYLGESIITFNINVGPDTTNSPVIVSKPDTVGYQEQLFVYQVSALDADGDKLTFSLVKAPEGMSMFMNGLIQWIPHQKNVGENEIEVGVTDGKHFVSQIFELRVNDVNDSPVIKSVPIETACDQQSFNYQVLTADVDQNDAIHYQLLASPEGMEIDSMGNVSWIVSGVSNDSVLIKIQACDDQGECAIQEWYLHIVPDVISPTVSISFSRNPCLPNENAIISVSSSDNVSVSEQNLFVEGNEVLIENGKYLYKTGMDSVINVTATVIDLSGNESSMSTKLYVSNNVDTADPEISLQYSPKYPIAGERMQFIVSATDDHDVDIKNSWLKIGNNVYSIDNGTIDFVPLKKGLLTATLSVYDVSGNNSDTTINIQVTSDISDVVLPTAKILSPNTDTVVSAQTEIIGTVSDANLAYYTLSYRNSNQNEITTFKQGIESINAGLLGVFDATRLLDGNYVLYLNAFDISGNIKSDSIRLIINSQCKIGAFSIAFSDLNIPLCGINLEANRIYDSRDGNSGDFGFGWNLNLSSIKLFESCRPGDYWSIEDKGNYLPEYSLKGLRKHNIQLTIPGGKTQSFNVTANFFNQYSPTYGEITYSPEAGTYSKLEALDAGNFYVMGGVLYDENGDYSEPYNPQKYKLTMLDGTSYIIDQDFGGVTKVTDPNHNSVAVTSNGISHSLGMSIWFSRDSFGRITQISDNTGRVMHYYYDGLGNLSKVIDPSGAVTRFKYNQDHYLQEIIDPRGVRAARVEYDTDGRMIRQINPAGDTVLFTHDMDNNREVVSDFRGNETEYTYDNRGNVLTKKDAAGNEWEYTYDQHDNVIGTVDPNNHQKSSTFDARGNELASTDELNRTVTRTYTTSGQIATEVDALNRTSRYDYDTRGNLLTVTGPDNTVTGTKTYDTFGNVLTEKDALGFITKYTYDNQGRMVSKTDPAGRTARFVLDCRGNTIMEINPSGDTTRSVYDIKGNLIMSISPTGDSSRSVYNVFGKVARQIDIKGNVTVFEYDIFGQLKRTIAPDSTFTEKEYDADGNTIASIDETGRRIEFEYDSEKRVTRTIAPDNSGTRTVYDKLGRRTASIDAKGIRTEYEYDAVGNNTIVRDPYGTQTTYVYDNANRKVEMIDALSQHTSYAYDDYDRLIRTTFDDNTYTETSYDANGRKTAERDQQGKVTQFAYDSLGNLVTVTDAMNHVTRYTYDSNNNRISQTDANNHATTMEYDRYNRMTKRTYPGNGQERFGYDISGAMLYKVSGNDSTVYSYDNRNREVLRTFTSGHSVRTTYTPEGKRDSVIDYRGVTTYAYDSLTGQLTRTINPDSSWIEYAYDINKNRVLTITPWDETRYTYDSLNRMKQVIQGEDTTQYFYNSVGNRDSVANANGTSTAYGYDRLNRLLSVTNYDAANAMQTSYTYTLNNAGMRTQVSEHDGSVVAYTYDDSYKLTSETRSGTHPYTINYTYDNVGNRLTQVKDGVATTYTYNNRDQLLDEVSTADQIHYTYDNSGRMETKSSNSGTTVYSWIDDDRLETIVSPNDTISYAYDADNMRVASVASKGDKLYLIDKSLPYGQVIAEYDSTGSLKCGYVYGLERISQRRNGGVHYYVADGQGSIRALTDTSGSITDTYFYTAFGEELAKTGTTENEFRYVGEQWDPNAGFYYLRARWYDQSIGRFLSSDRYWSKVESSCIECGYTKYAKSVCTECQQDIYAIVNRNNIAKPKGTIANKDLHRYLYTNNCPTNFYDPKGEMLLAEQMQAVAIIGILATTAILINKTHKDEIMSVEPKGTWNYNEPMEPIPGLDCFPKHSARMRKCDEIRSPVLRSLCKYNSRALLAACLGVQFLINPFL